MLKNSLTAYGVITKSFHWLIALLVIFLLLLGLSFPYLPGEYFKPAINLHKSIGLLVLTLIVLRLVWRLFNIKPRLPAEFPQWEKKLANMSHWLFYLLLILMPISGWIMSVASDHTPVVFGLFSAPLPIAKNLDLAGNAAEVHKILAWIIAGLLFLHVSGVIKHYFFDRVNILRRML